MPGTFGRAVSKSFWGDLQLQSGASLHARIFGSYNGQLMDDLLDELAPIHASDIIIVNFGAWYPAFAWQVCLPCAGSVVMQLRVQMLPEKDGTSTLISTVPALSSAHAPAFKAKSALGGIPSDSTGCQDSCSQGQDPNFT